MENALIVQSSLQCHAHCPESMLIKFLGVNCIIVWVIIFATYIIGNKTILGLASWANEELKILLFLLFVWPAFETGLPAIFLAP